MSHILLFSGISNFLCLLEKPSLGSCRTFRLFQILLIFSSLSQCSLVFSQEIHKKPKEILELTHLLHQWPQDFNAKNAQKVCELFASDLIASYQGGADKSYDEMCHQLSAAISHPDKIFHYEIPEIEQIIVDNDIAVVRLIWTLKISNKNHSHTEIIKEKGLDVFKRQNEGSWKIIISYAYPET